MADLTEKEKENMNIFNPEEVFDIDFEEDDNLDAEDWVDNLDGDFAEGESFGITAPEKPAKEKTEDDEEDEDDPDGLNFDDTDDTEEEEGDDVPLDVQAFNKKMKTDFKSEQELIDFMKDKDKEAETPTPEVTVEQATGAIDYLTPFLDLDDKELMMEQFRTIAMNQGKDLNDEDVMEGIEDQVQELIDGYTLSREAGKLRRKLEETINGHKAKKTEIETANQNKRIAQEQAEKETLQKEFLGIKSQTNFFGIDLDTKRLSNAYKKVSTGKFLEEIQSNPKLLATIAVMDEFKEEISKKSSGLTYSDGLKAVLDDYKSKKEERGIVNAQKLGSSGSSDNSKDIIAGFTK